MMNDKKLVWLGAIIGSTLGGLIPGLWHASMVSPWGLVFSALGGFAGIWAGWKIAHGG
jgi:hypothetical protein